MSQIKTICLVLCIAAYCVQADKYTDENRPYEFGFTIEGEQHRHEKKDENGIIMGEFGFITADGVYHVTVYATDENGNFKILSMKNIRVKPYPTAPAQNLRQGHSLELSSSPKPKTDIHTNNGVQPVNQQRNTGPARTCSHCSVPTTTTPPPKPSSDETTKGNNNQQENQYNTQSQLNGNAFGHGHDSEQNIGYQKQLTRNDQALTGQQNSQNFMNRKPSQGIDTPLITNHPQNSGVGYSDLQSPTLGQANLPNYLQTFETNPQIPNAVPQYKQESSPLNSNTEKLYAQSQGLSEAGKISDSNAFNTGNFNPKTYDKDQNLSNINKEKHGQNSIAPQNNININRQPKSFNDILESVNIENEYNKDGSSQPGNNNLPKKPVLIAAQMQIVDKNTDIYYKNPGEKDGLPEGVSSNDMKQLLYTFNYTLGFHGHHEEGYTNGAKYGYYFVTGRNGIRTRVDYIADESGFHPKITQEVLDILSDDVPKPETEKDDKYGLKGYEFKWLYYPVNS